MEQNKSRNEFYDGSDILSPFTSMTGLPIDQVNFLACQLLALVFGYFYRICLGPHRVSPTSRHLVQILIGVPLTYFCFGRQILHLLAQSVICLFLMRLLEPGVMEKVVLVAAMAYLCVCHTYRLIYDYGGYTLDITGPLMLNTQRLSSLAFSLADGRRKDSTKLTPALKQLAVREFPSVVESLSYVFCFHGLMCGPFCFYNDYITFINGTNYTSHKTVTNNHNTTCDEDQHHKTNNHHQANHCARLEPPNPMAAFAQKFSTALFYGIMTICVLPRFPVTILTGPQYSESTFMHKMFLMLLYAALQRQKYYFAWKLGESVNVISGLGFNGYDEKGVSRWDLIDNADIVKVETSTSLKELLDNWNRSTTYWLRYVIYDRIHSTVAVFLFSAFWHGFYAGYYITFCTGGIFIHTARLMRRRVRPFFLVNQYRKFMYDAITFTATRIAIAYLGFPFLVLGFQPVFEIYCNVYFWMHICAILLAGMALLLPFLNNNHQQQLQKSVVMDKSTESSS